MNMDVLIVIKLILVGHAVAVQSHSNVLQKCKNCFITSSNDDCCHEYVPDSIEECMSSIYDQANQVIMVAFTPGFFLWRLCHVTECSWSKFIVSKTSYYNSTTFRLGYEQECNNVTLMHYDNRRVSDKTAPDVEFHTTSDSLCTTHCVETAFNGTDCTAVFSGDTCKIYLHTSCDRIDFHHQLDYDSSINVLTCDYRTECCTPGQPRNGTAAYTELGAASAVSYSCDQGYTINGSEVRTCQLNLTWDGIAPSCEHVNCGTPQSILNGQVAPTSITYQVEYVCDAGFVMSGSNVSTCQADETWDNVPVCEPINCDNPMLISNGNIYISSTVYQDVIQYTCDTGFKLSGPTTRTCTDNGSWSGIDPFCASVDCGPPPVIANGTVTVNTTTYQQYANYSCSVGFVIFEQASITCQDNGLWTEPVPYCVVDCGEPDTAVCGNVTYNSTLLSSIANYKSPAGCEIIGHNQTFCMTNGFWSNSAPNCSCIQCEELGNPVNGFVHTTNGRNVSSVATYTCKNGYMLSWQTTRICSSQGMWSSSEPSCELPVQTELPIFISPCYCYESTTFGNMSQQEIMDLLVKDTKIDTKSTTKAHRKLISSTDSRQSSTYIGSVSVLVICVVFGSIFLIDGTSVLFDCRGPKFKSIKQRWRRSMT